MSFVYSFLYTVAFLVALPYFLVIAFLRDKYWRSAWQRLGMEGPTADPFRPVCWFHAVSVGEFLAARRLIQRFVQEYPDYQVFISTTTLTGQELARKSFPEHTFFFPFDWKFAIRRVLRRIRPSVVVVMETEIWPNFLWELKKQKIPAILVNGRLSDRSYQRYRRLAGRLPLFDLCLMQAPVDAERMRSLGAKASCVQAIGNLKFDFSPPVISQEWLQQLQSWKKGSLLWIAGSTMAGEEEVLLEILQDFNIKLLIAPRHPERFETVAGLLKSRGVPWGRRTTGITGNEQVLLLDTIGELASSYEAADFVFIGGTLHYGGHNPIEPAYFGKAVLSGPHYENFRAVFEEFFRRNAILITGDLKVGVQKLIQDPAYREQLGRNAGELVRENQGVTEIVLQKLREKIDAGDVMESGAKSSVR